MTTLVHGADETERIKAASAALFGAGDLHELDAATLAAALAEAAHARSSRGDGLPSIVDLLVAAGLSKSKGEARRTVERGRRVPQQRADRATPTFSPADTRPARRGWLVLRRGKKHLAGVEVTG